MNAKGMMSACLVALVGLAACAETKNVEIPVEIANSGFEDGKKGWSFCPNMSVTEDRPHGGKACALIDQTEAWSDGVYITRLVPVEAGAEYGAECFIRTEDVKADERIRQSPCGASLIVEWYSGEKKWMSGGEYAGYLFGTKPWTKVRAVQLKAPADSGYAMVYLALRGSGKAWFDDVRFFKRVVPTERTEPADGAALDTNTPHFGWKYRVGARRFSVVLSRDPAFPKEKSLTCDAGGFYGHQLQEPLAPGKWYWKVTSKGQEQDDAWSFTVAEATAGKDLLAPQVMSRAKRVTSDGESFTVRIRERNGVPKAEFLGVTGVCTESAAGEYDCRFAAPASGWPKGFVEGVIKVADAAGNRAESPFWFLNAPKPENAVVVGVDGMFHEKDRRIFPLGIYEVAPKYMAMIRRCGYDVVHTYEWEGSQDDAACRAYLDECWKNDGLRAFIGFDRGNWGPRNGIKQGNFAATARRVGHLADHPGLFCWYLFDEPEHFSQFATPDVLVTHADIVRALDPFHPVVMSTWDRNMCEHRRAWDTHWSQAYGKPADVVSLIDSQRRFIGSPSPVTTLLNCNDGVQTAALTRKEKVEPLKTKFQRDYDWFRACAHLAVVKETNGIWWWWFAPDCKDYVTAAQVPQAWEDLTRVNREIIALRPLLAAEGPVTTGRALDGQAVVEWWAKIVDGRMTAIIVNTAENPVSVEIDLPLVGRRRYDLKRFEVKVVGRAVGAIRSTVPGEPDIHWPGGRYAEANRCYTAGPSIAIAPNGRLWATWHAGNTGGEDKNGYIVLATSADDGKTWRDVWVADPDGDGPRGMSDPQVWVDPDRRLRWSFSERQRKGAGTADCADARGRTCLLGMVTLPDANVVGTDLPEAKCLGRGVMMGKPLVLSDGTWMLPVARWWQEHSSGAMTSSDRGRTWTWIGGATLPPEDRCFDEHSILEAKDGTLHCYSRMMQDIFHAVSRDRGKTWTEVPNGRLIQPSARFLVRRLASGNWLMVKHGDFDRRIGRSHLKAFLSKDEGRTWEGGLMLDERENVSYPDGDQRGDGLVYVVYDHSRCNACEVSFATFTEEDVLAGRNVSGRLRLRQRICGRRTANASN